MEKKSAVHIHTLRIILLILITLVRANLFF